MIAAVRRLGAADWQVWRAARLTALADAPEAFGSTLEREQGYDEARWRAWVGPDRGLKAVVEGNLTEVAGVVGTWLPPERGGVVELYGMWVGPAWRGRGVGDALVAEALAWSREEGHSRVELWVVADNAAAQRLYARHGFRLTEESQPHPRDPQVVERVMAVEL